MKCNDCGNQVAFCHSVTGIQIRLYDESGTYDGTEREDLETTALWCAECESRDVERQ